MMKFGLDFGTTNSCLCYYNAEQNRYEFIRFGDQRLDFFPTLIAYGKDGTIYIGEAAKEYQFDEEYDFYYNYKLLLGEKADEKNGRLRSPKEVMKDFLESIMQQLRQMNYLNNQVLPENMVMTVPDVWKNEENNQIAIDNLLDIYTELGFYAEENVSFESEPASAAAYYCNEICKGAYNGHLVVVDYGGGTLDLTLCKVEDGNKIYVLARCGQSGIDGKGCAGNAFDTAMTHRIIDNFDNPDIKQAFQTNASSFMALKDSFERSKINTTQALRTKLKKYYKCYDDNEKIGYWDDCVIRVSQYALPKYSVNASDIAEVFEQVNASALRDALKKMKDHCNQYLVNTQSQDGFRVLLAGGFSNLYCVESEVRKAFDSNDAVADRRFDEGFNMNDRSTAIAKGAALIASNMVQVFPICQTEIGFYYFSPKYQEERTEKLVERGREVQIYREPVFSSISIMARSLGEDSVLRLYFDDGNGKIPFDMDTPFQEMCPHPEKKDNQYQVGISLGRMQIPFLHIRDADGNEQKKSINRIPDKKS